MKLFYRTVGEGKPLIILHGLFGSSDNWLTHAKTLGKKHKVYLVDLRNHGASPHDEEFTYNIMVKDLLLFIKQHDLIRPDILGHSMGGKVAMLFATKYPDQIDKLIVVDIAPKFYPVHHNVILEGLKAIPVESIESRQEADDILADYVDIPAVRQFLLKNLKRVDHGYAWKMNLDIIYEHIANVGYGLSEDETFEHETLFIRGSDSDYIEDSDIADLNAHFPKNDLVTIHGASHWVHVEEPEQLLEAIGVFLDN